MKLRFLIFETKAPAWVEEARNEYSSKLNAFQSFEVVRLKSPVADRDSADVKTRREGEILLKQLDERDLLILFDEGGRTFASSEHFSEHLGRQLESGKARILFCIGGPYGFDDAVKARSQEQWALSKLTLNHWIAQLAALEQLYRGMTLIRNIPYHNR